MSKKNRKSKAKPRADTSDSAGTNASPSALDKALRRELDTIEENFSEKRGRLHESKESDMNPPNNYDIVDGIKVDEEGYPVRYRTIADSFLNKMVPFGEYLERRLLAPVPSDATF